MQLFVETTGRTMKLSSHVVHQSFISYLLHAVSTWPGNSCDLRVLHQRTQGPLISRPLITYLDIKLMALMIRSGSTRWLQAWSSPHSLSSIVWMYDLNIWLTYIVAPVSARVRLHVQWHCFHLFVLSWMAHISLIFIWGGNFHLSKLQHFITAPVIACIHKIHHQPSRCNKWEKTKGWQVHYRCDQAQPHPPVDLSETKQLDDFVEEYLIPGKKLIRPGPTIVLVCIINCMQLGEMEAAWSSQCFLWLGIHFPILICLPLLRPQMLV